MEERRAARRRQRGCSRRRKTDGRTQLLVVDCGPTAGKEECVQIFRPTDCTYFCRMYPTPTTHLLKCVTYACCTQNVAYCVLPSEWIDSSQVYLGRGGERRERKAQFPPPESRPSHVCVRTSCSPRYSNAGGNETLYLRKGLSVSELSLRSFMSKERGEITIATISNVSKRCEETH